ncbi:lysylphosphatidylglycerol synthase transmembrane domain-containing protein [Roseivirga sp. E12]|uniref:lysylphosphatidylglycerol synthase transmembrane domain-containing protein n=1 Tax=Roseivirga sp. E12 TaxID=2819237 RepID=UPI001ABD3450|nr:lysylphosphatidylglycerol synthase transmembrane domain-containing protein [Roseivirga sp. E12]MBO3699439.1 flippase-like domain-containing protein [Roseivirga sp. E12]
MRIAIKDILKFVVSIGLTGFVLYKTSGDVDWSKASDAILKFNYGWILLSVFLSIISHLLRAYRWNLMLNTGGYNPSISTSYLALMVGYLSSMAIPRLGEVTRCTVLKRTSKIPVSFSLGTVFTDRLLDLFMLALLTLFLLSIQFDLLKSFFIEFVESKAPIISQYWPILVLLAIGGLAFIFWLIRKARQPQKQSGFVSKVIEFMANLLKGMKTIAKVKSPVKFWLATFGIWILYFFMLYVISFGYGPTDEMSFMAGVAVLVMGSLGMATPVNNGIGAYQAFVASILVVFGIVYEDGYVFAIISQGSQVVAIILIGFISLLILNFRNKNQKIEADRNQDS